MRTANQPVAPAVLLSTSTDKNAAIYALTPAGIVTVHDKFGTSASDVLVTVSPETASYPLGIIAFLIDDDDELVMPKLDVLVVDQPIDDVDELLSSRKSTSTL